MPSEALLVALGAASAFVLLFFAATFIRSGVTHLITGASDAE